MLDTLHSIAACLTIWLAVLGAGRPAARRLKLDHSGLLTTLVWSGGLGLAACGWVLSLLGYAGLLQPTIVGLLTLAAAFWGLGELYCVAWELRARQLGSRNAPQFWPTETGLTQTHRAGLPRWLLLAAAGSAFALLLGALAPPTSLAALCGELATARHFLEAQSFHLPSDLKSTGGPALAAVWYQWALALEGPVAAGLLAWSFGLLAAGATALVAREVLGRGGMLPAAALMLLAPGLQQQMAAPLSDVAATAFATLALAAWWRTETTARRERDFALAGAMLGTALSISTSGLGIALAIGGITLQRAWRSAPQRWQQLQGLAVIFLMAFGLAAGWQLRGLGTAAPPSADDMWNLSAIASSPLAWLGQGMAAVGAALSALLVAALLLGAGRELAGCGIILLVQFTVGVLLCRDPHAWLPLLPLVAVVAAWGWQALAQLPEPARRVAFCALGVAVVVSLASPAQRAIERTAVVAGLETRDDFLTRQFPEYAAVALLNEIVPAEGQLATDEPWSPYFRCRTTPTLGQLSICGWFGGPPLQLTVDPVRLKQRGVTHLLVKRPDLAEGVRCPTSYHGNEPLLPLADLRISRRDGSVWRYQMLLVR